MPFTFSHPVVAILFKKPIQLGRLSLTGVVLGSIAPDLEYYFRLRMQGDFGHQAWGIVVLDLPLALLVAFIFHQIIRDALIDHVPIFLKQRLIRFQGLDWWDYFKQHWFSVVLSIFLGILTHIVWDAFTHKTGFFVQNLPFLNYGFAVGNFSIPIYKVVQHASSLLGLGLILYFFHQLPKQVILSQDDEKSKNIQYWLYVFFSSLAFFSLWFYLHPELRSRLVDMLVAGIACGFWGFTLISMWYKSISYKKQLSKLK